MCLASIKCNGISYPLEVHALNHRQAHDRINEQKEHVTVKVPDDSELVEYLIYSINYSNSTLQVTIYVIKSSTRNSTNDSEIAAHSLIEICLFKRKLRISSSKSGHDQVSNMLFTKRGDSGVDFLWNHPSSRM